MTFVKGNIKQGGRKKGTPNNNTKLIRDKFEDILNEFDTESLIKDLKQLEPLERLKLILSMSEFITPKMQRQTINLNSQGVDQPLFPEINWIETKTYLKED